MQFQSAGFRERGKWAVRGLIAGLVIGMLLGWFLHGIIGVVIKVGFILLLLAIFAGAVLFWNSTRRGGRSGGGSEVQEASWRDLDRKP